MRKICLVVVWLSICCLSLFAKGEKEGKVSFSLEEAKEYALKNSYILKNSNADVLAAKKKVWETTAQGLPQVDASGSYTYMLKIPSALEQFANLGSLIGNDEEGEGSENGSTINTDDIRYTATMDIKVTQLIFSGPYLVGLQASKTYRNISELMKTKNTHDVLESVTNSYVLVLVAEENKKILQTTLKNLKLTLQEVTAMYKEGFVEDTEVDQLRLSVQNVENSLSMLIRQEEIAERLLKFQIGMDITSPMDLTDNLDDLIDGMKIASMMDRQFDVTSNINYKLIDNQEKIAKLNLKLKRTEYLPTLAAFYNHQKNFNDKAFNMNPSDLVGVSVTMPIFSSGMRKSKVNQAKIEYQKAKIDKQKATQGLILEYQQAKTEYLTSWDKYKNDKGSMELGKRIYDKTLIKYKEGVSSSLDLTQTQNQYLEAQGSYFNSVMELFKSSNKLEKVLRKN